METIGKQEYAYSTIRERILNGTYGPGYRLVIQQLAREFGTSPIPVREAIRRLEAEGLVQYHRNTGPCVAPMDEQAYVETLSVLALLEGHATALAAPHISAEDIARLREINRSLSQAVADLELIRYSELNREFHQLICDRCPNGYLVESIQTAWKRLDAVRRSVFTLIPSRVRDSMQEHEELINLIDSAAPAEQIELVARRHKLNTLQAFQSWERGHWPSSQR